MAFKNRDEAARRLADRLTSYRGMNPLVLAIPRGGVPMGRILADALEGELDVVLVRKLGAPGDPEVAIGSVHEGGHLYLSPLAWKLGVTEPYVQAVKAAELEILHQRRDQYTPVRPPIDPAGRIAIVVDDGLATGSTMIAALRAVRAAKPRRLVAATPVASAEALRKVRALADEVVCLEVSDDFLAVGHHYEDFEPVGDEEAMELLKGRHAGVEQEL